MLQSLNDKCSDHAHSCRKNIGVRGTSEATHPEMVMRRHPVFPRLQSRCARGPELSSGDLTGIEENPLLSPGLLRKPCWGTPRAQRSPAAETRGQRKGMCGQEQPHQRGHDPHWTVRALRLGMWSGSVLYSLHCTW